jgi:hypothetical protein
MNPGTAASFRLDSCHSERNKAESFLPRLLPHPMELGSLSRKPDGQAGRSEAPSTRKTKVILSPLLRTQCGNFHGKLREKMPRDWIIISVKAPGMRNAFSYIKGKIIISCRRNRDRWPHRMRHELSSPTRTLGLWVQNPLETRMSVCVYSVCVALCVGSDLATD